VVIGAPKYKNSAVSAEACSCLKKIQCTLGFEVFSRQLSTRTLVHFSTSSCGRQGSCFHGWCISIFVHTRGLYGVPTFFFFFSGQLSMRTFVQISTSYCGRQERCFHSWCISIFVHTFGLDGVLTHPRLQMEYCCLVLHFCPLARVLQDQNRGGIVSFFGTDV